LPRGRLVIPGVMSLRTPANVRCCSESICRKIAVTDGASSAGSAPIRWLDRLGKSTGCRNNTGPPAFSGVCHRGN